MNVCYEIIPQTDIYTTKENKAEIKESPIV